MNGQVEGDRPAADFYLIPPHRATADTVLTWPVFADAYSQSTLVGAHFVRTEPDNSEWDPHTDEVFEVTGWLRQVNEERLSALVERFLQNVHTKNPVLDVELLLRDANRVASYGLDWRPASCLVLLAAALGVISKPFNPNTTNEDEDSTDVNRLREAETYFVLACRRLGGLKHSIQCAQCFFFAGAWQYFIQASNTFRLYMKTKYSLSFAGAQPSIEQIARQSKCVRRQEEAMYWSCFKSESEFRVELPLPQSELAYDHHLQMFPTPPSPAAGHNARDKIDIGEVSSGGVSDVPSTDNSHDSVCSVALSRLYTEEESWYYYLTEIALRRIGNRIINSFFHCEPRKWLNIQHYLGLAREYDTQLAAWSAHLPEAMKHWETASAIRQPDSLSAQGKGNAVSQELGWALANRLLEARSWLYQPFLYWLVHSPLVPRNSKTMHRPTCQRFVSDLTNSMTAEDAMALYQFIISGIECSYQILETRSLRHRHHGLWYDLRSSMCVSLVLMAIVKSGHTSWLPDGGQKLWQAQNLDRVRGSPYLQGDGSRGRLGRVMAEYGYWAKECPSLERQITVLKEVIDTSIAAAQNLES
ncbi:hypothetical protein LTR78_009647 [Recurvomyces mirabilis]|uniref:Uncharacterized protein n=1 Tax=Recurvomyces mirabilis TaxID=574656 RepID=A0AAE0TND8_9PEZI|nr:hypothetical protein LTR78_009647 [Recurvomyces mirabilis]